MRQKLGKIIINAKIVSFEMYYTLVSYHVFLMYKYLVEGNKLYHSSLDVSVVWLGVGSILAWLCIIRYLKITESFSLLIETIYRAKWDIMAYLICVGVLFGGFLFCGYVVLGPYHVKFQTLTATTEALFALIQGDEIYATFAMFEDDQPGNASVLRFTRFFIGLYICLFTVVAINLLIALLNTAYETIHNENDKSERSPNFMELAIKKILNQHQDTDFETSLHTLLSKEQSVTDGEADFKKLLQDLEKTDKKDEIYRTLQSFLDDHEKRVIKECCCCSYKFILKISLDMSLALTVKHTNI